MAFAIGCADVTAPPSPLTAPAFAQGDDGIWTVNSLADPGDAICDDTECTLREAIAAAASGGRIVFAANLQGAIQLTAGELVIFEKDLAIDGAGRITIDAQRSSRVLLIDRVDGLRPAVDLAGLTFENGLASGSGGGILMRGRSLTLDRVTVSSNEASSNGGGISVSDAQVTIRNSVVADNVASVSGGGLYNSFSNTLVVESTVSGNQAVASGGGILNEGRLHITASTLMDNRASNAGGIVNAADWEATIERSTISGNRASAGGIGGLLNLGTMALRSSTLTRNTGFVGGIGTLDGLTVSNSIVAGNEGSGGFDDCTGSLAVSAGHNVTTVDGCPFSQPSDVVVPAAVVFAEVLEEELADNGGPTLTHALIVRGRAVDAGYCPGESEDQRGFGRPVDDAVMPDAVDACDIGAYELQGSAAAVADLMISQAVDRTSVKQGDLLTYSIRVRNLGPETAPNVVVNDILSSGVTFVEARMNRGTHTAPPRGETGTVTWYLGDVADQGNEVAEIVVTVLVKGKTTITNTATVTGDVADPNGANNSAAITVSVGAGSGKPKK